jgi:hypothetical protein
MGAELAIQVQSCGSQLEQQAQAAGVEHRFSLHLIEAAHQNNENQLRSEKQQLRSQIFHKEAQ